MNPSIRPEHVEHNDNRDPFMDLTWEDLERRAGGRIVTRGRKYQVQGRVSELSKTHAGSLIAWVHGSERYAPKGKRLASPSFIPLNG